MYKLETLKGVLVTVNCEQQNKHPEKSQKTTAMPYKLIILNFLKMKREVSHNLNQHLKFKI